MIFRRGISNSELNDITDGLWDLISEKLDHITTSGDSAPESITVSMEVYDQLSQANLLHVANQLTNSHSCTDSGAIHTAVVTRVVQIMPIQGYCEIQVTAALEVKESLANFLKANASSWVERLDSEEQSCH